MKKIGIITFYGAHNYGAMLQAFALNKFLITKKYDSFIVNYYDKKIYNGYKVIRPLNRNFITSIKNLYYDFSNYKLKKERYKSFLLFNVNKLNLTTLCKKNNDVISVTSHYDCLIAGSDQIWNPGITKGLSDIYTLNFAFLGRKISYAASVGDIKQIDKYREDFTKKISQIDNISVREIDAKEKIEKIVQKDIDVVLDPTLLLNRKAWDKELVDLPGIIDKYIVAYVVKPDEEYIKIVNDLSEKTGLKVLHFGLKNPGYKNVWKSAYTEGPLEFVNYIKNAEYVVATSFHATVFSIIFNKSFFIIPHRQTGSRVTNLLDQLGIDNRVYYSLDEFKNIDYKFDTDWEKVEKKLEEERERSINWLINAIEGKEDKNV